MWRDHAACTGLDPSIFFENQSEDTMSICQACVVRVTCLEYARSTNSVGVWGGTSTSDRGLLGIEFIKDRPTSRATGQMELRTITFTVTHEGLS